ncbi:MAG: hypothetical protein HXX18_14585 [Bacteroidetes bacterium]|nr:hypothetical protein [Bacteroidota bacterium]
MKIVSTLFTLLTFCLTVFGQPNKEQTDNSVKFDSIIKHFKERNYSHDKIRLPLIYQEKDYEIVISDNSIAFDLQETVLKNPFDSKYPISYSVVYQDKLVSLFEPGTFVCHSIPALTRDTEFERKVNTKKFQYHWLLDNKLVGISDDKYYYLNSDNVWLDYTASVPFTGQPKLFEDSSYISFCDCHGEWGGTVYFYNKTTKKIYFTEATCANSILKKNNEYLVLSHLGHMEGSTELKAITNPDKLSLVDLKNTNKPFQGQLSLVDLENMNKTFQVQALGNADSSKAANTIFEYYDIQIFSSFTYQGKTLYLVYWRDKTFLAELKNNTIQIVNPLFNRELYTHNPITTNYDNTILMNLDYYGIAREREVSCIIIKDNQLIKFDWNEKHSR